jgi:hypothetical protein
MDRNITYQYRRKNTAQTQAHYIKYVHQKLKGIHFYACPIRRGFHVKRNVKTIEYYNTKMTSEGGRFPCDKFFLSLCDTQGRANLTDGVMPTSCTKAVQV